MDELKTLKDFGMDSDKIPLTKSYLRKEAIKWVKKMLIVYEHHLAIYDFMKFHNITARDLQ